MGQTAQIGPTGWKPIPLCGITVPETTPGTCRPPGSARRGRRCLREIRRPTADSHWSPRLTLAIQIEASMPGWLPSASTRYTKQPQGPSAGSQAGLIAAWPAPDSACLPVRVQHDLATRERLFRHLPANGNSLRLARSLTRQRMQSFRPLLLAGKEPRYSFRFTRLYTRRWPPLLLQTSRNLRWVQPPFVASFFWPRSW